MSGNAVDFVKSNGRDRKKKELSQRQICLKRKITKQKENRTERKVGAQCFGCRRVVFFFRFGNFLRGPASPLLVSVDVFFCRIFFFSVSGPSPYCRLVVFRCVVIVLERRFSIVVHLLLLLLRPPLRRSPPSEANERNKKKNPVKRRT